MLVNWLRDQLTSSKIAATFRFYSLFSSQNSIETPAKSRLNFVSAELKNKKLLAVSQRAQTATDKAKLVEVM